MIYYLKKRGIHPNFLPCTSKHLLYEWYVLPKENKKQRQPSNKVWIHDTHYRKCLLKVFKGNKIGIYKKKWTSINHSVTKLDSDEIFGYQFKLRLL